MPGLLAHMGNTYHYSVKWGKKYTKVKYLKYNPSKENYIHRSKKEGKTLIIE